MRKIIVPIFLVLIFLCSTAMGETAVDWFYKANALSDGKKYTDPIKAIEYLNNAIKLQPDYETYYYNRGVAYDNLGQYQPAIKDYNQAIRLQPDYPKAYNNRGINYLSQGNNTLGCSDAQKACALGNCKLLEMAKGRGVCP
jgi:tetratricopeptide (TPR) repeat protein